MTRSVPGSNLSASECGVFWADLEKETHSLWSFFTIHGLHWGVDFGWLLVRDQGMENKMETVKGYCGHLNFHSLPTVGKNPILVVCLKYGGCIWSAIIMEQEAEP